MTDLSYAMSHADPAPPAGLALVDLLDRVLATGVVITGEITISIAGVDLIYLSLRALLSSTGSLLPAGGGPEEAAG